MIYRRRSLFLHALSDWCGSGHFNGGNGMLYITKVEGDKLLGWEAPMMWKDKTEEWLLDAAHKFIPSVCDQIVREHPEAFDGDWAVWNACFWAKNWLKDKGVDDPDREFRLSVSKFGQLLLRCNWEYRSRFENFWNIFSMIGHSYPTFD